VGSYGVLVVVAYSKATTQVWVIWNFNRGGLVGLLAILCRCVDLLDVDGCISLLLLAFDGAHKTFS
jgi:hypothetical protein